MGRDIKNRLSSENSQRAINRDVIQKVNLESKERLLPSGEINHIVDVGEQFNKERQASSKYRLISNLKPMMSNVLFNVLGDTIYGDSGWDVFNGLPFRSDPYDNDDTGIPELTYTESYKEHLKEVNGWFGYYDPNVRNTNECAFYDMEPTRERFSLTKPLLSGDTKWFIRLAYPNSIDDTHTLVDDGLKIIETRAVNISNRNMSALGTATNHNLNFNDSITLSGLGGGLDGEYRVIRVGLDDGDFKENFFVIDVDPTLIVNPSARVKRLVNGQESKYYFRKFKVINLDYDSFEMGFGRTIFEDPTNHLVFNDDFNIEGITDNLGRPLSEIYVSFIKSRDGQFFSQVKSGIECPLLSGVTNDGSIPDIRRINNSGSSHVPLEILDYTTDEVYGDIVEYNPYEVKEVVLNKVYHRFNTTNRDVGGVLPTIVSNPRYEGYYYNPHFRFETRTYSSYVEQGDSSVVGIPSYAEDLGDGRFLWRDLLDIGIKNGEGDGVDYPFENGAHYLYGNINLCVKRQDPFGDYGLYYNQTEPIDISGNGLLDNYSVKSSDEVC